MAVTTDFEIDDAPMMDVDAVMAQIENSEPSLHLEIKFLEGKLQGETMLIGEWVYSINGNDDNGDVSFNVNFVGRSKEETDELIADNANLIRNIAIAIIKEAAEEADNMLDDE